MPGTFHRPRSVFRDFRSISSQDPCRPARMAAPYSPVGGKRDAKSDRAWLENRTPPSLLPQVLTPRSDVGSRVSCVTVWSARRRDRGRRGADSTQRVRSPCSLAPEGRLHAPARGSPRKKRGNRGASRHCLVTGSSIFVRPGPAVTKVLRGARTGGSARGRGFLGTVRPGRDGRRATSEPLLARRSCPSPSRITSWIGVDARSGTGHVNATLMHYRIRARPLCRVCGANHRNRLARVNESPSCRGWRFSAYGRLEAFPRKVRSFAERRE